MMLVLYDSKGRKPMRKKRKEGCAIEMDPAINSQVNRHKPGVIFSNYN